ncbi:MAG TPA: hypothetical protein VF062_05945 [Candidatus Limnocylindrales bacterium]
MTDDRFFAVPGSILGFSRRLRDLTDDGQRAAEYAREHIYFNNETVWEGDRDIAGYGQRIPESGVLFREAMKALKALHFELSENYQHLWSATQASGAELKLVADHYAATDQETARRLDRQYGEKRTK